MGATITDPGTLERRPQGRLVAGVCRGVADRYGVDVRVVRFATMLLTGAAGAGAIAYAVAWATVPIGEPAERTERGAPGVDSAREARADAGESIALLLIATGLLIVLRALGMWISDLAALVVAVAAAGLTLVWGDVGGTDQLGDRRPLRIAVGVLLLLAGLVALGASSGDLTTVSRSLISTGLAAAGVALLFGPYLARLSDELDAERRSRIRVEERAEIAAHLHDGVLQTLALVQKRADDPKEVARLARRQERELRSWLHGATAGGIGAPSAAASAAGEAGLGAVQHPADSPPTVAARLRGVLADVEDDHGVRVELVSVGDHPFDQAGEALVSAVREAAVNAARHSGAETVDVFVEAGGDVLEAFVRDRGVGFDPAAVAADRRGLSESIVGRIERAGGTAVVTSTPGRGTEVQLSVPSAGSAYRRTTESGQAP